MDATERLRERAQNEATCIKLSKQNKELRAQLAALKEAARPIVMGWSMVKKRGEDAVLNCAGSGYRLDAKQLDALAALLNDN